MNTAIKTNTGDKAIITYLRQAFEDCEQIAEDNPTHKDVARLITALHDQFDHWMRYEPGHDARVVVLAEWLSAAQDLSGVEA